MLCDEEEGSPKVCYSVKAQTVFDELSNYFFLLSIFQKKKVLLLSIYLFGFTILRRFFPCLYEASVGCV